MSSNIEVRRFTDADAVATAAAETVVERLQQLIVSQEIVHLVITGGTVGILTLKKLSAIESRLDWSNVHIWWGDERFVVSNSPDRNAKQAADVWLGESLVPKENIHEFPSSDGNLQLDDAASAFDATLAEFAQDGLRHPRFDILLLGMGPDGHVASLFPGKIAPANGQLTIAEHDSPKPPPQRLSLSYEVLNSASEVWFTVAGADKAGAVTEAFANPASELPVARVRGIQKTVWFVDDAAGVNAVADSSL